MNFMRNKIKLIGIAMIAMVINCGMVATAEEAKAAAAGGIEASAEAFGVATLGDLENPKWGAGAGLTVFVHPNVGVNVQVIAEDTVYKAIDEANASLVFRQKWGSRFSTYEFAGGLYGLQREAWDVQAGAGIQLRVTDNCSVFTDGAWIYRADVPRVKFGLSFGF